MGRLGAQPLSGKSTPRVAVIGSGAFGGWTALHLAALGAQVEIIDSWGPGNPRSSSGGETRVIRAIYGPDRIYVEMVKRAYELWETLIAASGQPLYTETGALWMHRKDDAYVRSSVAILQELGFPVDKLTIAEAKGRYPQIDFRGVHSAWLERRAGALSARQACGVVRDAFQKAGGTYRQGRVQPGAIAGGAMTNLRLDDGSRVEADAYVFACGPWLGKLFPEVIGDRIRATRQEVYYFGTPAGSQRYLPAHLPIWIDFGERIFYGIPDVHGRGFKIADDTRGAPIDPTSANREPTPEGIARARHLISERFPELAHAPLVASEVCQYENSPDGHLIIDRHPAAANVWLAGGGSGHGFKLSPAVGEMTAQMVLSGKEVPKLFRLDRLRDDLHRKTQFESK
ncbi:MAG TPA: FAD-dependent oxidoreductase [Thermoanaerobaculia bacterium]|jgi:monomeric sarcosine oxidase|nr:FAD-dependent oxidoreductase [Thermoanaerobaculia bacterium]